MNSFGWHDVFQSTSLRETYGIRNASITYSGMETKIVYAVGCVSMVFVGVYAIVICVANSFGTTRRNCTVAPMNDGRSDIRLGKLDKDLSLVWPTFVVAEMHAGDAGSSRCDTLSKEHHNAHQESLNVDRNDGTAKKQRLDRTFRSFPKAEPAQDEGDQVLKVKESIRTSTASDDAQGSSLVERQQTSQSMRCLHRSSSRESLMACMECLHTSTAGSLQACTAREGLHTYAAGEGLQTSTAREGLQTYAAGGLQTYAAGEGLQTSTAIESLQTNAAGEGLQTSTAGEGLQTYAAGEGLQAYTARESFQTSAARDCLQTSTSRSLQAYTARESLQTSADRDGLQTSAARDGLQTFAAEEGLQISTPGESIQASAAAEGLQASTAGEDLQITEASGLQRPTARSLQTFAPNGGLQAPTAKECFQASTVRGCLRAATAIEDFQESTSIEGLLTPPASESSTAMEVLQTSSDSGFPLPSGGTDGPLLAPVTRCPRPVSSNSHLYSPSFTDTFHGRDQGSPPRLLNTLWSENVFKLHRPARVFPTSNSAPNLRSAPAWDELEHNTPLCHPQNSVHMV